MTNDIVALIDFYEREKGIERDRVQGALEYAFVSAYRKMVPGTENIENLICKLNTKRGEATIWAALEAIDDEEQTDKFNQVPLSLARKKDAEAKPGDIVEFNVTPKNFGRIAIQTAKQTMLQRLRMAEKEMIYEEFKDRAGDIVSGTVRRFEKGDVMIDLGKFEGRMPSKERVVTEDYNVGDRLRAYVVSVDNESRGPEIILSRSHNSFVRRLFEAEVTEIADGSVELRGIAREAGYRTKAAVYSSDSNIDPVGACVGMRGSRVKNIVNELNNEKVDILRWSDDVREFVTEALKPATLRTITLDEEKKEVVVTVDEDELSKAIGRRGQNARLTSKLLGWDVQVRKDETKKEIFEAKVASASSHIAEGLNIDEEKASALFNAGGVNVEMVSQMPADYVAQALEIEESEAAEIIERAVASAAAATPSTEEAGDA